MGSWERNTPWRQGHLIGPDILAQLGIDLEIDPNHTIAVVATHDCDLAQGIHNEPEVELILGTILEDPLDGNYTHCKNLRRLHVGFSGSAQHLRVQLETNQRHRIPKEFPADPAKALASYQPKMEHVMDGSERGVFQRWLAARYRRSAFPDEFDRRLKGQTKIADRLAKCFKDSGKHIPAVFFDVDQGVEISRNGENDVYELSIIVLYSTSEDPEAAELAAKLTAKSIQSIFEDKCKHGSEWKWIELLDISVISDEALTYAQSTQLIRWQADHISLKADPEQPLFKDQ